MSNRQGRNSPSNQKLFVGRTFTNHITGHQEVMDVEQTDYNSNVPSNETSEHERSPNLSNLSQEERQMNWFNPNNRYISQNELKCEDSFEVDDENDEARASGVVQGVFKNISQYKLHASRAGDQRVVDGKAMIRCLPWKVLVIFHPPEIHSTMGVFVQCNVDNESQTWSCNAKAVIQLVSQRPNCPSKEMKINHTFTHKENDWGFQQFITYDELFNPERGFITENDDTITIRVMVKADAPHGADWDSKRHTGYVGLKNQGATCYLNSLLQALYCTNKLRRAVFLMPTESDDAQTSVPLALQRVFYELQFSSRAVGTKKLTRSFGWATLDSFMQHDAQELCRVLLDNLENKMKGTSVEDVIPGLFCGKMLSYINCLSVPYQSKREENFYDIQLKVNGNPSVYAAFKEYIAKETLSQDNKYDAGSYGLQEAEKGVIFTRFPPVLYLQLMRFQYDFVADTNIKLNDRFEFPYILKLDEFLAEPKPSTFILHAVLVHSGDNHGGHYVVYINPALNGVWYQFDDDVVSRCSEKDAIDMNFGGTADPEIRLCTNAYMLVYIAENAKDDVLCNVSEIDIPESLRERFIDEQRFKESKRKQRQTEHLFTEINLLLEEDFYGWQGPDVCGNDSLIKRSLQVPKQVSRAKLVEEIATQLNCKSDRIKVWRFQFRRKIVPPQLTEVSDTLPLSSMKDALFFYVQCNTQQERDQTPADKHLFFLKYFDVYNWSLTFCGSVEVNREDTMSVLEPILCERAGLPQNCSLIILQDDPKYCMVPLDVPISKLYKREVQGQVLYFQVKSANHNIPLPMGLNDTEMGKDVLNICDQTKTNENVNGLPIFRYLSGTGGASGAQDNGFDHSIDPISLHKLAIFPSTVSAKSTGSINKQTLDSHSITDGLTINDYINSYLRQLEILLVDKLRPTDAGILISVSKDLTYWKFAKIAASYLSTKEDRLQFFRSQQGSDNDIDQSNASVYVSTVGSAVPELHSPNDTGAPGNTMGSYEGSNLSTGGYARGVHTNPQMITAKASGFPNCSPHMNNLVSNAASKGLSREPPGSAISSTHPGNMEEFFTPLSFGGNTWNADVTQTGMVTGGTVLSGNPGNAQTRDHFPYPLNRFCGMVTVNRSLFGNIPFPAPRRVYYAHLAIGIDELETMRQVRVIYVGPKLSERAELLLSVPQNGVVADLIKEASRHITLPPGGSGQLRLLKVFQNRIIDEYLPTFELLHIPESSPVDLRLEEVPLDELNLRDDETVVYVSHFDKSYNATFGVPFTIRIQNGETYSAVRERIRKRLEVPEKEFDRWRFAVIFPHDGTYIPNSDDPIVQIERFIQYNTPDNRPWLGIDHKPSKRPRVALNEKPIKIHN